LFTEREAVFTGNLNSGRFNSSDISILRKLILEHLSAVCCSGAEPQGKDESGAGVSLLVSASALSLAACGGGEGSANGVVGRASAPVMPAEMTPVHASRFLGQAQLFATQADIDALLDQGYTNWLNTQFNMPIEKKGWDWLFEQGYNALEFRGVASDYLCWKDLISAPDTLRKRVALILSEVFVVSQNSLASALQIAAYWDLLNEHAFGNFFDLLKAVTLSPAMGRYLNTSGNKKADPVTGRQPDENYAREVMQLFTLGLFQLNLNGSLKRNASGQPIETYSQEDVTELAKVFTGWVVDNRNSTADKQLVHRNPMRLVAADHSNDAVSFLGSTIPANTPGEQALDMALRTLFQHPNVAPFWARQLIQMMVTSNPSADYVERVARAFENNGNGVRGDMRVFITAVLLDPEARDPSLISNPDFGKLREPIARYIQWARTFNARPADDKWRIPQTSSPSTQLGQSPFRSPSVFNFFRPNYVPSGSEFSSRGMIGPEFQLLSEVTVAAYVNFMEKAVSNKTPLRSTYSGWLELAANPVELVNQLVFLLVADQMSNTLKQEIVRAVGSISIEMNRNANLRNRLYSAIVLILASPQYLIQK
jgi:uncharacterized protein (DUF1800 family)